MNHINGDGKFQSDKYPDLAPDKIILSFNDPIAKLALMIYAWGIDDIDLKRDIITRLSTIGE